MDLPEATHNGPGNSTLTSRISLQKFCCVVAQFDDQKRQLAKETGFGELLEIKISHKTNLKFSTFLMERMNPDSSKVVLGLDREIEITDQDVQNVFGLPLGTRLIPGGVADMSEPCMEFTRLASAYSPKGIHSLKAAESVLCRPLGLDASSVDRDCFKIAYVVFSIGHVLNPSAKHDYTSVEYWAALVVPSEINSFNWCRYVRDNLLKGARKIKTDIVQMCSTIQIIGCHLLLQIVVLDKLSLSRCCIPQNIYPRIKVFDHATIKRAIGAVTQHVFGGTIFCGTNCHIIDGQQECSYEPPLIESSNQLRRGKKAVEIIERPVVIQTPTKLHSSTGAVEFANEMRRKYPHMASELLGILLKEHNSRVMANMNEIRHNTQVAMYSFVDSLVNCLAQSCTCCKLSGRNSCLLRSMLDEAGTVSKSQGGSKLPTNTLCRSMAEGSSSGCTPNSRKRIYAETSAASPCKTSRCKQTAGQTVDNPNSSTATDDSLPASVRSLSIFIEDLVSSIVVGYTGRERTANDASFSQCTEHLPTPVSNGSTDFTNDTCYIPRRPLELSCTAGQFIEFWMSNADASTTSRIWFKHPSPRYISVEGSSIRREIIGMHKLSHECCALIVRRLCQMDHQNAEHHGTSIWRKIMEPDFTTIVLRGIDPRYVKSIQRELTSASGIDKCMMFIFPALLEEGWCCYILDMMRKRLIVLDPYTGNIGFTNDRLRLHDFVSTKILECFFICIKQFYTDWQCNEYGWTRSFSTLTSDNFESHDHGICALFMGVNHDGDALTHPATKDNIKSYRLGILYELMRLGGNESKIPCDALESIKSSFT